MLIGSKVRINQLTSDPKIVIGGHRLKRVVVTKSLGLMIDENLSWEEHVNYMSKKVAKGLAMLRRIRDLLPINTLVDIYSSIIHPHFDYCISMWDNCRNTWFQRFIFIIFIAKGGGKLNLWLKAAIDSSIRANQFELGSDPDTVS